jgi:hypothetical protein
MKTKSGLAFEFVTTNSQEINNIDTWLKKLLEG